MFGSNSKTYSRNCGGGGGTQGKDGERGFDGNSSLWKAKEYKINEELKKGEFFFNHNVDKWENANSLLFNKLDYKGNNLTKWFLHLTIGDILIIRNKENINDVAYYRIDEKVSTVNNLINIKIVFINSGTTEFYSKNKFYFVSFVKTGPTQKSYNFGVHIVPIQDTLTTTINKTILGMESLSLGNNMTFMDNIEISFKTNKAIGWIYPNSGGFGGFNISQPSNHLKNFSDRTSIPTGSYLMDTTDLYSQNVFHSVDTELIIDKFTELSWMFGPVDINSNLTLINYNNGGINGLAMHIIHIPHTNKKPVLPNEWNFIRVVINVNDGMADTIRLNPKTKTNVKFYKGLPKIPWDENSVQPISNQTINVKPGDALGICIFSNNLCYKETINSANRKISPLSLSFKPRVKH